MGSQGVGRAGSARGSTSEHGLSLVEMMIALLVLGVILSAFASSLISFSKMTLVNERRVQATAFLTRLHEDLQSIPWDQAAIYEDEVSELAALGADLGVDPPTLDDDPVVLLETPDNSGCDEAEPNCARSLLVPASSGTMEIDGRSYDYFQAVTWDTTAPVAGKVKRFTTLVRWRIGENDYEQLFESTRAVTAAEAEGRDLPEIRRLLVSPSTVNLDGNERNVEPIDIDVEFDRGMTSAYVEYTVLVADGTATETRTMPLDPLAYVDAKPVSFIGTIPSSSDAFLAEEQQFRVVGMDDLDAIVGTRSVTFVAAGAAVADPPVVSEVIVSSTTTRVGSKNEDDGRICNPLTVTVRIDGLVGGSDPGTVTLYYLDDTSTGVAMSSVGAITGSGDVFTRVFEGLDSPWRPTSKASVPDILRIIARNPDGGTSAIAYSADLTFSTNANEKC